MEQAYIYGIDDLYNKWELLLREVEKKKISEGRDFYADNYYTAFAVVLLSWYGISVENMILIQKDDVSSSGIKGYEKINFDNRTLDFLMMYVNTDFIHRNKNFGTEKSLYMQSTLIRTTEDLPVTYQTVADLFSKVRFPLATESEWIKKLFTPNQVLLAGQYDRIYQYGKSVKVNFADTNRNKNITQDMILHVSDIFDYKYDPQKKSSFIAKLKLYATRYYYPRLKWEESNFQIPVYEESSTEYPEPEKLTEQNLEYNTEQKNQEILIQKLSDKIATIQQELSDVQNLLAILKSNN
jgi:hypothetical protein